MAVVRQASELDILSKGKAGTEAWRQKQWHLGAAAGAVNKRGHRHQNAGSTYCERIAGANEREVSIYRLPATHRNVKPGPLDSRVWPTLTASPSAFVTLPDHLTFLHGSGSHAMLYKYSRTYGSLSRWRSFYVQAALCPEVQEPGFKVQFGHVLAVTQEGTELSDLRFPHVKHLCVSTAEESE